MPLVAADVTGIETLRGVRRGTSRAGRRKSGGEEPPDIPPLDALFDDLATVGRGVTMVMGKGGVGKTTIAAAIARGLASRGLRTHLSTTDPAGRPGKHLASGVVPGAGERMISHAAIAN